MAKTNQAPLGIIALLLNAAIEASAIFIPLLAQELGASYFEVGIVGLSYGMAYFVASFFFGWQSDRYGRVKFIKIGLGIGSVAFFLQALANNLPYLTLVRASCGFCLGISSAALIAYAFETEGVVGKFTSYGALGMVVGAAAAAIIKDYDYLFTASAVLCLAAFILSLCLKEETIQRKAVMAHPIQVITREWKVYLPFFLRQIGAWGVWIIMPLFLAAIGASKSWIAVLWMINFGAQFIAMRYIERFHEGRMFSLGLIFSGIVFLSYIPATHYLQVIPVQIFLGLSWSTLYVGALVLLMRSGEERGTSAGILFSITNLCQGLGPFLSGALVQIADFKAALFFAAIMSLAGLPLALKNKASK